MCQLSMEEIQLADVDACCMCGRIGHSSDVCPWNKAKVRSMCTVTVLEKAFFGTAQQAATYAWSLVQSGNDGVVWGKENWEWFVSFPQTATVH